MFINHARITRTGSCLENCHKNTGKTLKVRKNSNTFRLWYICSLCVLFGELLLRLTVLLTIKRIL